MRLYGVTPMIVLRRNIFKARHVTQQDYDVTTHNVYAVTLLVWKDKSSELVLRRNEDTWLRHLRGDQGLHSSKNSTRSPREITLNLLLYLIVHKQLLSWFRWISFDYRVTLGFGSIVGSLDHVNPVIKQPLERRIIKETSIRHIQDIVYEDSGRYRTWSLLQETSDTLYLTLSIRRLTPLPLETEVKGSILTPYKARGPFLPLVELEAASLPLVGLGMSTSQPLLYTVEDAVPLSLGRGVTVYIPPPPYLALAGLGTVVVVVPLGISHGLTKKYRLSLKNDMPPREKHSLH
ncbi:hypothetical protein Tco_0434814 [Tanacetum coccineum]